MNRITFRTVSESVITDRTFININEITNLTRSTSVGIALSTVHKSRIANVTCVILYKIIYNAW